MLKEKSKGIPPVGVCQTRDECQLKKLPQPWTCLLLAAFITPITPIAIVCVSVSHVMDESPIEGVVVNALAWFKEVGGTWVMTVSIAPLVMTVLIRILLC